MKRLGLIGLCFMLVFSVVACSSQDTAGDGGTVELTMGLFTGTNLEPLVEEYMKLNPNIKVKIQSQEYADHHNSLVTALSAGSGAPDIALVEIGYMDRFKADESKFYNLADFGANDIMGDYLEWKRVQASSKDGDFIFGIPTDIGPMAMLYRIDIFEKAGLSSKPEDVASLIQTWDDFIQVGQQIKAKTGKPMIDAASSAFNVIKGQKLQHYFDENNELIVETNPDIKYAWDKAVEIAQSGLTAKIGLWSPEWFTGMNQGDFAVMLAPAWMIGMMKGAAADAAGKWDVAPMPEGSGNWGGSFLTVPKESEHPEEAYKLIAWLLSPENQLKVFKNGSNFPSTPSVYEDPAIQNYTDPYVNNAPIGKIFAEAALKVVPVYYGPDYVTVDSPIVNALTNVERNGADPDAEWQAAIEQIKRDLSK